MSKPKARANPKKKKIVKELVQKIEESPSIGLINMCGMPANALTTVKRALRGRADLFMTRKTLIKLAMEKTRENKKGIEKLEEHMEGMPALIFSKENPFAVYKVIRKSKTPAAAKAGSIAPKEIRIPAGPTPFGPGPIISEFAQLGIKAAVEEGKVAIKADKVIAEGDKISGPMAGMLTRLGILPFEVGMDIVCMLENGTLFMGKVLNIDEEQYAQDITTAAREAFNLAVEAIILTTDTTEPLLQKAWREAKAIALEGSFLADEVVEELIGKAEREAMSLKTEAKV